MLGNASRRLTFIDVARSYAVFLALFAHAALTVGFFEAIGSDALLIKQFTRMATPMFVFMFGFMAEFVYVRKYLASGDESVFQRVIIRSFQCYAAYALTSFCAVVGGYKSIDSFIYSLFFFTNSRFGNILRVYAIILLLTPFVIKLRAKYGPKFMVLTLIPLVVSYSYIDVLQSIDFGIVNHQANVLLGIGLHRGGPSVYGALSFFLAGMIAASGLNAAKSGMGEGYDIKRFYYVTFALAAIFLVLGYFLIEEGLHEAWVLFADFTYRKFNDQGYYIIGTICSIFTIAILGLVIGTKRPPKALSFVLPIGTSSLISYTVGNALLNVFGRGASYVSDLAFFVAFFAAVVMITRNIARLPFYEFFDDLMNLRYGKILRRSTP